jgi:Flp pilus assembly protein TadD
MLKRYGIPGQRQYGVDIIDPTYASPFYGAQCKLREAHKNFRAKELRDEVNEAKQFTPKLDHYAIVTTAKIPTETDNELIAINKEHGDQGLFVVEIIKYDDLARQFSQVIYAATECRSPIHADTSTSQIGADLSDIKVKLDTLLENAAAGAPQDDISDAVKDVAAKKYAIAHRELIRIREKRWDKLSDLQKYDVAANLAVCSIALNEPSKAATLFFEAVEFKPTDERARTNVALAHALNESFDKANALASELMQEFPLSPRVAALWVSTAHRDTGLADLESRVSGLLEDVEVNVALGYRALFRDELDKAEGYAKRATSNTSADSRAWLLLGVVLIRKEIEANLGTDIDPPLMTQERRHQLSAAKAALDQAVDMARRDSSLPLLVGSLVQRSIAKELLGDAEGRAIDAEEAHSIDPTRVDVKRTYAALLAKRGDANGAITILKSIAPHEHDHGTKYMLGLLLSQRKGDGDIQEAVTLFRTVSDGDGFVPPGLRSQLLHLCIALGDRSDLDGTLNSPW